MHHTTLILHSIFLVARPAKLLALVGPFGASKSNLLDIFSGYTAPSSGSSLTIYSKPMPAKPLALLLLSLAFVAAVAHGGSSDDAATADPLTSSPNLRTKSLVLVKIWGLIIVFAATFAAGISPYFLKWNETFLVLGMQFAGGVFLVMAMIHFLNNSDDTLGELTNVDYPFAFMLACTGYVITMLADCVIAGVVGSGRGSWRRRREGSGKGD